MQERLCWLKLNHADMVGAGPLVNVAAWAGGPTPMPGVRLQSVPQGTCHAAVVATGGSSRVLGDCKCCPEAAVPDSWADRFIGDMPVEWRALAALQNQQGWHLEGPSRKGSVEGLDVTLTISEASFSSRDDAVAWLAGPGKSWSEGAVSMWLITRRD